MKNKNRSKCFLESVRAGQGPAGGGAVGRRGARVPQRAHGLRRDGLCPGSPLPKF